MTIHFNTRSTRPKAVTLVSTNITSDNPFTQGTTLRLDLHARGCDHHQHRYRHAVASGTTGTSAGSGRGDTNGRGDTSGTGGHIGDPDVRIGDPDVRIGDPDVLSGDP